MIRRLWRSPTIMTWGSYLTKGLAQVAILPFILRRFTPAEIALWYLFLSVIGLQFLMDAGFIPTFVRAIAYAMAGARVEELNSPNRPSADGPNRQTLQAIRGTMKHLYVRLSLLFTVLLATIGTAVLIKPIQAVDDHYSAWLAWAVILIVSTISLRGNIYSAYLQGINEVALVRRWEMLTGLGGVATSLVVLGLGGRLLALVCANQVWQVLDILRNAWLTAEITKKRGEGPPAKKSNRAVYRAVWPSAWRSGIGILMSYGIINASGLLYAQFANSVELASYLLAVRLFQMLTMYSSAPFYSLLPQYSRLYAEHKRPELVAMAQKGMRRAHWTYALAFVGIGAAGTPLLKLINAHVPFPSDELWALMGLGFFFERYGAMHIQLYSTTNRIIWHIANGITGTICVIAGVALIRPCGVYAFPLGLIIGYAGFYCWFTALHTHRTFHLKFLRFERSAALLPFAVVVAFVLCRVVAL